MITLAILTEALHLSEFDAVSAQLRMSPLRERMRPKEGQAPRQAGVLVLAYPEADGLHVVLTRRTEHLRAHSGQISFPGGRRNPDDVDFAATALRETWEELGVGHEGVTVIGALNTLFVPPSNYEVHPTVGTMTARPMFNPNHDEVAEVLSLPLHHLIDDQHKASEEREFNGVRVAVPYYRVAGHKGWGATAIMLSELEQRLRTVMG